MNIAQTKKAINAAGIMPSAYSFTTDGIGECYRLAQEGKRWHVYYAERGQKNTIGWFDHESDACECLLQTLLEDETTHQK